MTLDFLKNIFKEVQNPINGLYGIIFHSDIFIFVFRFFYFFFLFSIFFTLWPKTYKSISLKNQQWFSDHKTYLQKSYTGSWTNRWDSRIHVSIEIYYFDNNTYKAAWCKKWKNTAIVLVVRVFIFEVNFFTGSSRCYLSHG